MFLIKTSREPCLVTSTECFLQKYPPFLGQISPRNIFPAFDGNIELWFQHPEITRNKSENKALQPYFQRKHSQVPEVKADQIN
jgi:hypothetical protein